MVVVMVFEWRRVGVPPVSEIEKLNGLLCGRLLLVLLAIFHLASVFEFVVRIQDVQHFVVFALRMLDPDWLLWMRHEFYLLVGALVLKHV